MNIKRIHILVEMNSGYGAKVSAGMYDVFPIIIQEEGKGEETRFFLTKKGDKEVVGYLGKFNLLVLAFLGHLQIF